MAHTKPISYVSKLTFFCNLVYSTGNSWQSIHYLTNGGHTPCSSWSSYHASKSGWKNKESYDPADMEKFLEFFEMSEMVTSQAAGRTECEEAASANNDKQDMNTA